MHDSPEKHPNDFELAAQSAYAHQGLFPSSVTLSKESTQYGAFSTLAI